MRSSIYLTMYWVRIYKVFVAERVCICLFQSEIRIWYFEYLFIAWIISFHYKFDPGKKVLSKQLRKINAFFRSQDDNIKILVWGVLYVIPFFLIKYVIPSLKLTRNEINNLFHLNLCFSNLSLVYIRGNYYKVMNFSHYKFTLPKTGSVSYQ